METAGDGSESQDTLQTEEEAGDGDTELRPQETVRPDAPRTGTGGAAADRSHDDFTNALTAFAVSVAAIGVVSLFMYRRIRG